MPKSAAKHKDGKRWRSSKWIQPDLREAIYIRDGDTCMWCGASGPKMLHTLDHLYPAGPSGVEDNRPSSLVLSCLTCNSHRGEKSLAAWLLVLVRRGKSAVLLLEELDRRTSAPVDREAGRAALVSPGVVARKRRASWLCRQVALACVESPESSESPESPVPFKPPCEFIDGEPVMPVEEYPHGF